MAEEGIKPTPVLIWTEWTLSRLEGDQNGSLLNVNNLILQILLIICSNCLSYLLFYIFFRVGSMDALTVKTVPRTLFGIFVIVRNSSV